MVGNHLTDRDLVSGKKMIVLIGPAKRSRDTSISECKRADRECGEIFCHLTGADTFERDLATGAKTRAR
jgi:hypothetical protein